MEWMWRDLHRSFNSRLVRLVAKAASTLSQLIFRFNSRLVRLVVRGHQLSHPGNDRFNSRLVRLVEYGQERDQQNDQRFNSRLVRLVANSHLNRFKKRMFQFQIGAIGRLIFALKVANFRSFQFQRCDSIGYGIIRIVNSRLVRLVKTNCRRLGMIRFNPIGAIGRQAKGARQP